MPSKPDLARHERLRQLVGKGLNDAQISERLGMTRKAVESARHKLGLSANRINA